MVWLEAVFFLAAAVFAALGQGGGVVYVPLLVARGVPFHVAASASQAVIVAVSVSSMVVFHRAGFLDWKLVLLVEPATNAGAVIGGYLSRYVPAETGKLVFAGVLVVSAWFMVHPVDERRGPPTRGFAWWTRTLGERTYSVNWVATVPLMACAGALAGLLGVGGGLIKVPLMTVACGIPLEVAVGSSSLMVGLTALTGLAGHAAAGHFDMGLSLPLAVGGFLGAQVGSRMSVRIDRRYLRPAFGVLLVGIATWMAGSVVFRG